MYVIVSYGRFPPKTKLAQPSLDVPETPLLYHALHFEH